MSSLQKSYNMKKVLLIVFAYFLAFPAFAGNGTVSVKDLKERCKRVQNDVNILKNQSDNIKNAQISKLKDSGTPYKLDELEQLNDDIINESLELLNIIPEYYLRDTVSNKALIAHDDIISVINDYIKINYNINREIEISDSFSISILKEKLRKIHALKEELQAEITGIESPIDKGSSLDSVHYREIIIWGGVGLIVLVIFILVYVIISLKKLNSLVDNHDYILKGKDSYNLETDIKNLKMDVSSLKNANGEDKGNKRHNQNNSINNYLNSKELIEGLLIKLLPEIRNIVSSQIQDVIGEKIQNPSELGKNDTSPIIYETEDNNGSIKKEREQKIQPPKPKVKPLYAQLQNNGTFKVYDDDKRTAFFVIIQDSSEASTASFELKELNADDMQSAIANRTTLLTPACDIESITPTPKKIKVLQSGTAIKNGKDWTVKEKAIISLE